MLGWEVMVFRAADATGARSDEPLLATWQTGPFGLQWLNELVKQGKAISLGGDGYPKRYSVRANVLLPIITGGPPPSEGPAVIGDDYFLPKGWNSTVTVDRARVLACSSDELLLVEAWDQS